MTPQPLVAWSDARPNTVELAEVLPSETASCRLTREKTRW